jgi:hypothetical protein
MYMNVTGTQISETDISNICMDCITQNAPSLLQQEKQSNAHFTSTYHANTAIIRNNHRNYIQLADVCHI